MAALRAEFDAVHCVCIPHLLEPSLLTFLEHRLERGEWQTRIHKDVAEEYTLHDSPALNLLHFIANFPDFRNLVQEITGCGPLRRFKGRIYRMTAAAGHYDHWHDDNFNNRLVGMSLNLSRRPFRGGLFRLRERESETILAQIANTALGSALIFRIADHLQHRISDMEGDEPKTAFAGWFRSDLPDLFEELHTKALRPKELATP
ncbi:MAG: 2OG-Fe(II) oxygenase [Terriglobales bacterium]